MTYMSTKEVANLFRVSPLTIRRWVRDGRLKPFRVGKHGWMKFNSEEIEMLLITGSEVL